MDVVAAILALFILCYGIILAVAIITRSRP
jgi:hypothetical protein